MVEVLSREERSLRERICTYLAALTGADEVVIYQRHSEKDGLGLDYDKVKGLLYFERDQITIEYDYYE